MIRNRLDNLDEWFWPRVDKSGDCWIWTGKPRGGARNEYGIVKMGGKRFLVHRVAMGLPADSDVLHRCGTYLCVNPAHLYLGDDKDNAADRTRHGRASRRPGELHPMARLTAIQVSEIRTRTETARQLSDEYGVTASHIRRIRRGKTWKEEGA